MNGLLIHLDFASLGKQIDLNCFLQFKFFQYHLSTLFVVCLLLSFRLTKTTTRWRSTSGPPSQTVKTTTVPAGGRRCSLQIVLIPSWMVSSGLSPLPCLHHSSFRLLDVSNIRLASCHTAISHLIVINTMS